MSTRPALFLSTSSIWTWSLFLFPYWIYRSMIICLSRSMTGESAGPENRSDWPHQDEAMQKDCLWWFCVSLPLDKKCSQVSCCSPELLTCDSWPGDPSMWRIESCGFPLTCDSRATAAEWIFWIFSWFYESHILPGLKQREALDQGLNIDYKILIPLQTQSDRISLALYLSNVWSAGTN